MRPYQVLPLQLKVDLGIMVMEEYSTLLSSPEEKPHHLDSHIGELYPFTGNAVSTF